MLQLDGHVEMERRGLGQVDHLWHHLGRGGLEGAPQQFDLALQHSYIVELLSMPPKVRLRLTPS